MPAIQSKSTNRPVAESIAHRFRLTAAPTVLTSMPARSPIVISHLLCKQENHGSNRSVPLEEAYAVNILVGALDAEIWLHGKRTDHRGASAGGLYVFNLQSQPVVHFRSTFDIVRVYLSRVTLDELTREAGMRPRGSLASPELGAADPVMHLLAKAMLPALTSPFEANQLYVDYMSLAFHAHLVAQYGGPSQEHRHNRPALTARQARLATELIASRLDGKVSVRELAALCSLSQSHFARAFVHTFGMPPHRWLLERRVEQAKLLMESGPLPLTDIAFHCGFASQSHLTRVFSAITGTTPGKWRRMALRTGINERIDNTIA